MALEELIKEQLESVRPPADLHRKVLDRLSQPVPHKKPPRLIALGQSLIVAGVGLASVVVLCVWFAYQGYHVDRHNLSTAATHSITTPGRSQADSLKSSHSHVRTHTVVLQNSFDVMPENVAYISRAVYNLYSQLDPTIVSLVKVTSGHSDTYALMLRGDFQRVRLGMPPVRSRTTTPSGVAVQLAFTVSSDGRHVSNLRAFDKLHHTLWRASTVHAQYGDIVLSGTRHLWSVRYEIKGATAQRPDGAGSDFYTYDTYRLKYLVPYGQSKVTQSQYTIKIPGFTNSPTLTATTDQSGTVYSPDHPSLIKTSAPSELPDFRKIFTGSKQGVATVDWHGQRESIKLHVLSLYTPPEGH